MKKIKIFAIFTILAIVLVGCKGKEVKEEPVKKEVKEEVQEEVKEDMTKKEKKSIDDLLIDIGDTELDRTENELELVTLANEWISELAQINIDLNEVKNITVNYLSTAEPTEIGTLKEMFPKLNDYAIGLINGDSNTLGLLKGADEELEENIITETQWIEVYEVVLAEVEK